MKFHLNSFLTLLFACVLLSLVTACGERKASPPVKGEVTIETLPKAGASVLSNGNAIGVTPKTISGKPGEYWIKLTLKGFQDKWVPITITANGKETLQIKLDPVQTSVLIESTPGGATVSFNGKVIGSTPVVIHNLASGNYSAQLKKTGYAEQGVSWTIDDQRPVKSAARLISNIGRVEINSIPTGAQIQLDGKTIGYTPFKGELEDGKYQLALNHTGYIIANIPLIVERGKDAKVTKKLDLLPGTIFCKSVPEGATVYLDGKEAGVTPLEIPELKVEQEYTLKFAKKGFADVEHKVTPEPGKTANIEANLSRTLGDLQIIVSPPGVTVYLNDKKIGVAEEGESKQLSKVIEIHDLEPGDYTVKIAHKRANPASRSEVIRVAPGKITRADKLKLWIANVEIRKKNGTVEIGILHNETETDVYFEPEAGVRYSIKKSDIESINRFDDKE